VISAVIVATTIAGPVLFLLAAVRISPGATLPFYAVTGCHGLLRDLHSKLAVIAVIFCQIDALG
jgi:hypothetical protein